MSNENMTTTNSQNIIGKLDSATLARRLSKTKTVRDMERNHQERRARNEERRIREERENRERAEQEKRGLEAAEGFLKPLAEVAKKAADDLRAKCEDATRRGITRRRTDGSKRWISRDEQLEAIKTADSLQARGF